MRIARPLPASLGSVGATRSDLIPLARRARLKGGRRDLRSKSISTDERTPLRRVAAEAACFRCAASSRMPARAVSSSAPAGCRIVGDIVGEARIDLAERCECDAQLFGRLVRPAAMREHRLHHVAHEAEVAGRSAFSVAARLRRASGASPVRVVRLHPAIVIPSAQVVPDPMTVHDPKDETSRLRLRDVPGFAVEIPSSADLAARKQLQLPISSPGGRPRTARPSISRSMRCAASERVRRLEDAPVPAAAELGERLLAVRLVHEGVRPICVAAVPPFRVRAVLKDDVAVEVALVSRHTGRRRDGGAREKRPIRSQARRRGTCPCLRRPACNSAPPPRSGGAPPSAPRDAATCRRGSARVSNDVRCSAGSPHSFQIGLPCGDIQDVRPEHRAGLRELRPLEQERRIGHRHVVRVEHQDFAKRAT